MTASLWNGDGAPILNNTSVISSSDSVIATVHCVDLCVSWRMIRYDNWNISHDVETQGQQCDILTAGFIGVHMTCTSWRCSTIAQHCPWNWHLERQLTMTPIQYGWLCIWQYSSKAVYHHINISHLDWSFTYIHYMVQDFALSALLESRTVTLYHLLDDPRLLCLIIDWNGSSFRVLIVNKKHRVLHSHSGHG